MENLPRVAWNLTQHKTGTWYIHVPKEYASLAGYSNGDILEIAIFRVMKRPHGERKKE